VFSNSNNVLVQGLYFTTQEKHHKLLFLKVVLHYEKQASGLHAFCKAHVANIKPIVTWNAPSNDIEQNLSSFYT
jgi:hypothetical protein